MIARMENCCGCEVPPDCSVKRIVGKRGFFGIPPFGYWYSGSDGNSAYRLWTFVGGVDDELTHPAFQVIYYFWGAGFLSSPFGGNWGHAYAGADYTPVILTIPTGGYQLCDFNHKWRYRFCTWTVETPGGNWVYGLEIDDRTGTVKERWIKNNGNSVPDWLWRLEDNGDITETGDPAVYLDSGATDSYAPQLPDVTTVMEFHNDTFGELGCTRMTVTQSYLGSEVAKLTMQLSGGLDQDRATAEAEDLMSVMTLQQASAPMYAGTISGPNFDATSAVRNLQWNEQYWIMDYMWPAGHEFEYIISRVICYEELTPPNLLGIPFEWPEHKTDRTTDNPSSQAYASKIRFSSSQSVCVLFTEVALTSAAIDVFGWNPGDAITWPAYGATGITDCIPQFFYNNTGIPIAWDLVPGDMPYSFGYGAGFLPCLGDATEVTEVSDPRFGCCEAYQ